MTKKKHDAALDDPRLFWAGATTEDLKSELGLIKDGHSPDSARNLIHYFHCRMSNGLPFDEEVLHDMVAHVFKGIAEGKTLERAFGLNHGRGQYEREDTTERNTSLAASVELLVREGKNQKKGQKQAIAETAKRFPHLKIGKRTVERAYMELRGELEDWSGDELREQAQLLDHQAPQPS